MLTVGFGGLISVYPIVDIEIEEFGVRRITLWYLCDLWAKGSVILLDVEEGEKDSVCSL